MRWRALPTFTLLAFALGLLPQIALAGEPFVASGIKNDPTAKTVAIEIVADWNQVERYRRDNIRTDIIDFNGYWGGNLMIMVPAKWSVQIEFINGSSCFRHSLMVTRVYAQSEMPVKLTAKDAIFGGYTDPPEGIKTNERRQLNFVAQRPLRRSSANGFPVSRCQPLFALHRVCPSQSQNPRLSRQDYAVACGSL